MNTYRLKSYKVNVNDIQIVYSLIFQNSLYSCECYKEGYIRDDNNYSLVHNITEDEGEAQEFFDTIVKRCVYPVHIEDIVQDYFYY
ncbi:MAG: hypothetical protein GX288_02280 [Clostridiales bacterium]|nr:hypothetical protein [Clostridiales bacterium]